LLVVYEKCRNFLKEGFLLLYLGYFEYLVKIFRIGCSSVSLMKNLPPKWKMAPMVSISNVVGYLTYVNN
jgi:hypothetical protein